MLVIGITGNLGSGKTTVASIFARYGAKTIDADKISHGLITPRGKCFKGIVSSFGVQILKKGKIDRAQLGRIVFKDKFKLARLEKIIHPAVRQEIIKKIKGDKSKVYLLDIPLFFEAGYDQITDYSIVVKANREKQVKRAMGKLKISRAEVLERIKRQMPQTEKIRRADFIIDNNGKISQTKQQVKRIWQKIQSKRKN